MAGSQEKRMSDSIVDPRWPALPLGGLTNMVLSWSSGEFLRPIVARISGSPLPRLCGNCAARCLCVALTLLFLLPTSAQAQKQSLDELSLERWAKLREVERHQMKIAEKYYREKNWKVAAAEYDKYLSLYEASDAASHALLKWSLCHVNLRKQNTAIDDGFRSVIDYWPDSEEAIASAYYIGKTLKDIGQLKKAKPTLSELVDKHPQHLAGVYGMVALADIAGIEKDEEAQVKAWKKLTFDAPRNRWTNSQCVDASLRLASYLLANGTLPEAVEALDTTYDDDQLSNQVVNRASQRP